MGVKNFKMFKRGYMNNTTEIGPQRIPAILLKHIEYTRCEKEGPIFVHADTVIYVDHGNSIALIGSDHVYIELDEYKLLLS